MRFGLYQDCFSPPGPFNYYHRYHEVVEEAMYAERMGFDFWGTSEQHFSTRAVVSSPETLFAYVAAKTSRIGLRHMVTLLPFAFNHPIRVAEHLATLDIMSNGRAELYVGRGNSVRELGGFAVSYTENRAQMWEALEIIDKAMSQEEFEHHSELMDIPLRRLVPRALQVPHPPIGTVSTSVESSRLAGERGIGIMACDLWMGWEYLHDQISAYKSAIDDASPLCGHVRNSIGVATLGAYCDSTLEEAKKFGGDWVVRYHRGVTSSHPELADLSSDYEYMAKIKDREKYIGDLDFLRENTPTTMLGTPDDFIERIQYLESLGVEEITLSIDGVGHEKIMKSIGLVGKYVIPEFNSPQSLSRGDPQIDAPLPEPARR